MKITAKQAAKWTAEKTMTLLVVAFVVTVALVYDLMVVLLYNDVNATVSNTVYQASKRAPIIAFLIGLICGHLFWPITHFSQRPWDNEQPKQVRVKDNHDRNTAD